MLQAILNKSWRKHSTKQQLYSYLPSITKSLQVRWTRYVGHCWSNEDELIRDMLRWTPSHGWAKAAWPARTKKQHLCADTEDLPGVMDIRDGWWERVWEIHAGSITWWWYINIYIYICIKQATPHAYKHTHTHYIYIYIYANRSILYPIYPKIIRILGRPMKAI